MLTQALYLVVFCTRYLNLFWSHPSRSSLDAWNFIFKIVFIASATYIIALMLTFARTRERERAWKLGAACLVGALVLSPFTMLIFDLRRLWSFTNVCCLRARFGLG